MLFVVFYFQKARLFNKKACRRKQTYDAMALAKVRLLIQVSYIWFSSSIFPAKKDVGSIIFMWKLKSSLHTQILIDFYSVKKSPAKRLF